MTTSFRETSPRGSDVAAQLRIGDLERDRAAECLRDHLAQGRLDVAEFDERLEVALSARVQADLDPLFADLPDPRPSRATVQSATQATEFAGGAVESSNVDCRSTGRRPNRARLGWSILIGLIWTAVVSVCIARGWTMWWLLWAPAMISFQLHRRRVRCGGARPAVRSSSSTDWH